MTKKILITVATDPSDDVVRSTVDLASDDPNKCDSAAAEIDLMMRAMGGRNTLSRTKRRGRTRTVDTANAAVSNAGVLNVEEEVDVRQQRRTHNGTG